MDGMTRRDIVVLAQPPGFLACFMLLGIGIIVWQNIWTVLAALLAAALVVGVAIGYRQAKAQRRYEIDRQLRRQAALIADAERQDRLYLAGNPEGTYGDPSEIGR